MAGTGTVETSEELAVLVRNDFIESRHVGSVVVVDSTGNVLFSKGDPNALVFPRSAMKLFQAMGIFSTGIELSPEFTALATSSHTGSQAHVELVRELLASGGFTEADLKCATEWPVNKDMLKQVYKSDGTALPIYHCCSGKHAAMLLACKHEGWPTANYLDTDHPLQLRILEAIEYLTGETITSTAVDGCGAPVHAMPLVALASGVAKMHSADDSAPLSISNSATNLFSSMLAHPWVVGDHGEPDTTIMEELGFAAKSGYEGVFIVTTPQGVTVATKILDGNLRTAPIVALQALVRAGALEQAQLDALIPRLHTEVYGGGKVVGELRTTF
ncbi:asparaginase [Aurantimicrobium minutum]|uniref:asparaginase n=1 Tax=Aurantimicrobium minutum TaxID=708131 RepID=UPI0024744CE9|nr:asparaginase [Aurantimicrobium minutum]MDH6423860.1 L-asparaginase II [Aurantimicrobium minutum]